MQILLLGLCACRHQEGPWLLTDGELIEIRQCRSALAVVEGSRGTRLRIGGDSTFDVTRETVVTTEWPEREPALRIPMAANDEYLSIKPGTIRVAGKVGGTYEATVEVLFVDSDRNAAWLRDSAGWWHCGSAGCERLANSNHHEPSTRQDWGQRGLPSEIE